MEKKAESRDGEEDQIWLELKISSNSLIESRKFYRNTSFEMSFVHLVNDFKIFTWWVETQLLIYSNRAYMT